MLHTRWNGNEWKLVSVQCHNAHLILLPDDWIQDICTKSRSPKVLSYRKQSQKCRMIIGFSLMPTETKIKDYLRKWMFSSIVVISATVFIFTVFPRHLFILANCAERLIYFYTDVHSNISIYLTLVYHYSHTLTLRISLCVHALSSVSLVYILVVFSVLCMIFLVVVPSSGDTD